LAYITPHETQRPSSNGPGTQGWSCSDEADDRRAANRACATSGQCTLEEGERKERVTPLRRPYMTRSRSQKGYVFTRTTERGTVHVIRYRVRCTDGKLRHKAETTPQGCGANLGRARSQPGTKGSPLKSPVTPPTFQPRCFFYQMAHFRRCMAE